MIEDLSQINSLLVQFIKPAAFAIFLMMAVFYAVISMVFSYHWKTYGLNRFSVWKAQLIYLVVSVSLLVVAASSLSGIQ